VARIAILNRETLSKAVYDRLGGGRSFSERDSYFGASEVGRCQRKVLAEKVATVPETEKFSVHGAWKVLMGRSMENEVVQVLRGAGLMLRETGNKQVEVLHPGMPYFRCHPDGRVMAPFEHKGPEDGDGSLEAKSTSNYMAKIWIADGLPQDYLEQANSQMGLQGLKWGLFVAVWRETVKDAELPFVHWWILDFDAELYAQSEARAERMEAARKVLAADWDAQEEPRVLNLDLLPEGEPTRGYCEQCHLARTCKAYLNSAPDIAPGEALPDAARLELEVILEELADVEPQWSPLDKRLKALKEQAKPLVPINIKRDFVLDGGTVKVGMKSVSDFSAERLLAAIREAILPTPTPAPDSPAAPAPALDPLALIAKIDALYTDELATRKNQPSISLKPRKG
jgi:hypothetical protein